MPGGAAGPPNRTVRIRTTAATANTSKAMGIHTATVQMVRLALAVGRRIPLVQQLLLAVLHFGDHAPQLIHDLLAPVGEDDRQGGLKARLPAELDRLPQFGELGVGELLDLPEALLLGRVIAGQLDQRVDVVLDLGLSPHRTAPGTALRRSGRTRAGRSRHP